MERAKKLKTKGNKETDIRDEIRGFGVVIEHIDSKVSLVAEQYGDIRKTLDSHTEMIGSMKMNIEVIKADITFIKGGLKRKVDADEFSVLERRCFT